jgi:hypothetical protein
LFPALIAALADGVYVFGLKDIGLHKLELFAQTHHFPLLVVSDCEGSNMVYSFKWNDGNIPIPELDERTVILGYEPLTTKKFLELDSTEFGRSLWKGAARSQDAIKSSQKVFLMRVG